MPVFLRIACLVALAGATCCSLSTDLQDLSIRVGADAAADAQTTDATTDAIDGAPDHADGDAAEPATFACDPAPSGTLVCDDFETATAGCDGIGAPFVYGSGSAQMDPTHSVSPTHSAEFSAQAVQSGTASYACSVSAFTPSGGTVSVSFALRVNQADPSARIPIADLHDAFVDYQIALENGGLGLIVRDAQGGQDLGDYALHAYSIGDWIAVRLDLAIASSVAATVWVAALAGLEPSPASTTGWTQVFFKTLGTSPPSSLGGFVGLGPIGSSAVATDIELDDYLLRSF